MREPADIHCAPEEGAAYREGVYRPVDVDTLPDAPDGPEFPSRGKGPPLHRLDNVPRVPRLRYVIGPSVIALGMGLGAGEFLLWPNLIASNGFSIWWLFWVGVLTQFVVISEIERWTLATGESSLTGMSRLGAKGLWPWFFLIATLVSFVWPGWAATSAEFARSTINALAGRELFAYWQPVALTMLAVIWTALAGSRIVYNALEKFEIGLVTLFFPLLIVALIAAGVSTAHIAELGRGAVSIGQAPKALLSGDLFPTLLIAVAYAGSGGTLLIAQSLWIRDKGFGMGAYQGRISGIRGVNEPVSQAGFAFSGHDETSRSRFSAWMRLAERELLVTFVGLILLSVVITSLLVASTIGTNNPEFAGDQTGMVLAQAAVLRERGGAWLEIVFLLGGALILFSTQVGIIDTVTRITGDVVHHRFGPRFPRLTIKRTFLGLLTAFVAASMVIIALSWYAVDHTLTLFGVPIGGGNNVLQPNFLLLIAGPFTIVSMYAFAMVITVLNTRYLPLATRTPRWKVVGMYWAIVLWGWFAAEQVSRSILQHGFDLTGEVVTTIAMHPVRFVSYGVWIGSLLMVITLSARPGLLRRER